MLEREIMKGWVRSGEDVRRKRDMKSHRKREKAHIMSHVNLWRGLLFFFYSWRVRPPGRLGGCERECGSDWPPRDPPGAIS
jgi:hypothetical protein